jgi:hypothetical protein
VLAIKISRMKCFAPNGINYQKLGITSAYLVCETIKLGKSILNSSPKNLILLVKQSFLNLASMYKVKAKIALRHLWFCPSELMEERLLPYIAQR